MPRKRKRTLEPIAPTTIPGEPLDPKIPDDVAPQGDTVSRGDARRQHRADVERVDTGTRDEGNRDEGDVERIDSDEEIQARETEKAFDQAAVRQPPR